MAEIRFTAFVEDAVRSQQGGVFVLKTSETHRQKNDQDQWTTTGRTYRDVKVARTTGISLDAYGKGDRIEVVGTEKTEERPAPDGKRYRSLVVWADSIRRAGNGQSAVDAWSTPAGGWDESTEPF